MRTCRGTKLTRLVAAAVLAGTFAAPAAAAAAERDGDYGATIRRDAHGVPHIAATGWGDLGYGYGYSIARDNVCVLADTYATVRAERSRHFGPEKGYVFRGNGQSVNNLNSDFFFQRIIDKGIVEELIAQPPPHGPRPEVREIVRGYVAGYNAYLRDAGGADGIDDPACRGGAWVQPIEEIDAYRRFYQLALLASQGVAIDGIGSAQPPTPPVTSGPSGAAAGDGASLTDDQLERLREELKLDIGSNAYGLGRDATRSGGGMVLGNPHFPWDGSERFYQSHLRIPGKLNVSGGSLFGVPLVLIGTTQNLAWSHTVSTAYRFTPFELKLVSGSPTTYLVDGQPREMTRDVVTVKVPDGEGGLADRTRTLYSTVYGPIFNQLTTVPLPWTPEVAFAMGDANAANFRYLNHFFETNVAQSVREYDRILRRNQGIPWVNSVGADSSGEAYYADISVVPNVPNEKAEACNTALGRATFQLLRLPVLDGARSACGWNDDPDAVQRGIFGPSNLPSLFRTDYVLNSNDSYWLSQPREPLEGFARIIGDERTARSLRTRIGLVMAEEQLAGGGFTLGELQRTVTGNRQYAGELFVADLIRMCKENPTMPSSNGPVSVADACAALERWDVRDDLDSRGAVLFRRFAQRVLGVQGGPYREPFSLADPVNTPRGLNTENPQVRIAFGDAVNDLRSSGIPLDAPLGDWQYEKRGEERIPIHGGPGGVGVFNAINVRWTPGEGFPDIPHGSSFIHTTELAGRCPDHRTVLAYSQSTDPTSPFFANQTRIFSRERWLTMPVCDSEVAAARNLRAETVGEERPIVSLAARPARVRAGRRVRVRFEAQRIVDGRARPVRGALVRFAGLRMRTDRRGVARGTLRLRRAGRYRATASRRGMRSGRTAVLAVRR
jgi:acyl-homoserine-lactone acylase